MFSNIIGLARYLASNLGAACNNNWRETKHIAQRPATQAREPKTHFLSCLGRIETDTSVWTALRRGVIDVTFAHPRMESNKHKCHCSAASLLPFQCHARPTGGSSAQLTPISGGGELYCFRINVSFCSSAREPEPCCCRYVRAHV